MEPGGQRVSLKEGGWGWREPGLPQGVELALGKPPLPWGGGGPEAALEAEGWAWGVWGETLVAWLCGEQAVLGGNVKHFREG